MPGPFGTKSFRQQTIREGFATNRATVQQRQHELALARIANPQRDRSLDSRTATPNLDGGNSAGPQTFAPTGPVSTINGADRSNLGFGNTQRKRPGVGSLGFNPPPAQPQVQPSANTRLSDFLRNSRVS